MDQLDGLPAAEVPAPLVKQALQLAVLAVHLAAECGLALGVVAGGLLADGHRLRVGVDLALEERGYVLGGEGGGLGLGLWGGPGAGVGYFAYGWV